MEKSINLLEFVYNWLNNEGFIPKGKENLVRYCLNEDIEGVFGRVDFTPDEIDTITLDNYIKIESIFFEGKVLEIRNIHTQIGNVVEGKLGDKNVFTMTNNPKMFINQVNGAEKSVLHRVNINGNFSLSTKFGDEEPKCQDDYDVILGLTPYNAKFRDTEVFELDRIKPSEELPKSTLQRIWSMVESDKIVRIRTSNELIDNVEVSDKIFDELKNRTEKIRLANVKMLDRRLNENKES